MLSCKAVKPKEAVIIFNFKEVVTVNKEHITTTTKIRWSRDKHTRLRIMRDFHKTIASVSNDRKRFERIICMRVLHI